MVILVWGRSYIGYYLEGYDLHTVEEFQQANFTMFSFTNEVLENGIGLSNS